MFFLNHENVNYIATPYDSNRLYTATQMRVWFEAISLKAKKGVMVPGKLNVFDEGVSHSPFQQRHLMRSFVQKHHRRPTVYHKIVNLQRLNFCFLWFISC